MPGDNWGIESKLHYRREDGRLVSRPPPRASGSTTPSNDTTTTATVSRSSSSWTPGRRHGDGCHKCHEKFSLFSRKVHCRRCGLIFCSKCCSYKFDKTSRSNSSHAKVCAACFAKSISKAAPPLNSFIHSKAWVPRGVFVHMLSFLNATDLCVVSQACRWWYKRSSIDLVWRKMYYRTYGDPAEHADDIASFQRQLYGSSLASLPWKKKYAVRFSALSAAEQSKNFQGMSNLLSSLGLAKYADVFKQEEIDVESLCLMNAGHLRELGIPTGPRLKLLNAAAVLADVGGTDEYEGQSEELEEQENIESHLTKSVYKTSLVRRVQQSIVRIAVVKRSSGELVNVGSGAIIHSSGLIVTARHCLISANDSFNCATNPLEFTILVAPTESTCTPPLWKYKAVMIPECQDEELDVALCWIEGEVVSDPPSGLYSGDVTERVITTRWIITDIIGSSFSTIEPLQALTIGNSNLLEPGDEMWMFGYPSSGHNTITVHHAICSGTDSMEFKGRVVDKAWLRTAAQLDNGFSGGAAVDRKGHLVGFISFSVMRQDRVRSINMIKEFIELAKQSRRL